MLNRRSWGPLCWVMGFFTASYQQLLLAPNSIRVPEGPLRRVWFYLPHLISLPLQLYCNWLLSWPSYIIVIRSLDRLLDLWNRMFNCHQAEITVMQFRGDSLPVRQSMRVSWDFLACPILLANFRPRDFLSKLPLEWVTSFRCITLNGILGLVEGQNTTLRLTSSLIGEGLLLCIIVLGVFYSPSRQDDMLFKTIWNNYGRKKMKHRSYA